MYFFDLLDYYQPPNNSADFLSYNISGYVVGCAGSPMPSDFDVLFSTARESFNAFQKALTNWFLTSSSSCYTENPDEGCSPTYNELWVDSQMKMIDFWVKRTELQGTIMLYRYYYDYGKTLNYPGAVWSGSYDDYLNYFVNDIQTYYTGSTTDDFSFYNPYTESASAMTRTIEYGTSFEIEDLRTRVEGYDESMKIYMCAVKNLLSVIDGDTFDELAVNNSGDFNPDGFNFGLV
jgi:hypothetical protein